MDGKLFPFPESCCSICLVELKYSQFGQDGGEGDVGGNFEKPPLTPLARSVLELVVKPPVVEKEQSKHRTCASCDVKLMGISEEIETLVNVYKLSLFQLGYSEADIEKLKKAHQAERRDFSTQVTEKDLQAICPVKKKRGRPRKKPISDVTTRKKVKPDLEKDSDSITATPDDSLKTLSTENENIDNSKIGANNLNEEEKLATDLTEETNGANDLSKDENGAKPVEHEDEDELLDFDNSSDSTIKVEGDVSDSKLSEADEPNEVLSQKSVETSIAKRTRNGMPKVKLKNNVCPEGRDIPKEKKKKKSKKNKCAVGAYKCNECDITLQTHYALERHMRSHTGEKPFSCTNCDKRFTTKHQKTRHNVNVHSKQKPFKCSKCPLGFSEKNALLVHQRVHTGEKPYVCNVCESAFASPYRLKLHMRAHLGIYPYKCTECDGAFTRSDTLKVHMMRHTGEKPVSCAFCDMKFRTKTNYMQHVKIKHSENPKTYVCQVCSVVFFTKASLRNHSRRHTGEQPYLCSICGAAFKYQSSFDYHRKTHLTDKPFKCPHCPQTFKILQILKGHIRTHTGEKPFMCAVCGKAFSQQGQLSRHSVIHTDIKAHRCNLCPKAFNRKDKLTYHFQRMHKSALPNNEKKSNSGGTLKSDFTRPHKCPFCDKSYTRRSKVKEHLCKVHPNISTTAPTESTVSTDSQGPQPLLPQCTNDQEIMRNEACNNQSSIAEPSHILKPVFSQQLAHNSVPPDGLTSQSPMGVTSHLLPQGNVAYNMPYPTLNQNMCQELSMAVMHLPNVHYSNNK